ncbi:MAG: hypothetical protein OXG74_08930 [Acidobacteria bacterium]|nr:hypothetical protein [Acidobacteriota bacterium]
MNLLRTSPPIWLTILAAVVLLAALPSAAQEPADPDAAEEQPEETADQEGDGEGEEKPPVPPGAELVVSPTELTLEVGDKATLTATVVGEDGEPIEGVDVVFFSRNRRRLGVNPAGEVEAHGPGEVTVIALVPKEAEDEPRRAEALLRVEVEVTIPNPPVESVEIVGLPATLYAGTDLPLMARVVDITAVERDNVEVGYSSSNPAVAEPDGFGGLTLRAPGTATLTATAEDASSALDITIVPNPTERLELTASADNARTGDVVWFEAVGRNGNGGEVADLPVRFLVAGQPAAQIIAPGAAAQIEQDGAFVAERSGIYTVTALSGNHSASLPLRVEPRRVNKEIEFVGQGKVSDRRTSDLWVWEGTDGNDYAITGTWGAEGHAYIWDVTNPESIVLIDAVRVDARTVNDVKVSEDGRIAVISREGASNRKNGFVVLDVSEPQVGVRILSRFDDQLRGGVHNVFIHDEHVYALSNGRRFDVISIEDPTQPYRVGRFELETPGHSIHDVWVVDGVAFSSNWEDGVVAIDVGGAGMGGAPNNPVQLGSYAYPSGWNHAAYPYRSESTGKFYVFAGDEAFPYGELGRDPRSAPPRAAGWIHVISWDDWENPREVARYQVPEAGTHNLWIEDDIMYVAYYNGGLRVVDVSGELRGDLYRQGREIGMFMPFDSEALVPNAPFVWGPQPYKDHIFFSDWHSGLWAVKLKDPEDPNRIIGEPH